MREFERVVRGLLGGCKGFVRGVGGVRGNEGE